MAGDAGLCFEYQSDAFGSTHQRAHRSESGGGGGGGGGSGRVFTEPRAGNFGAQPRLKSRDASRRSTMVAESSFATRLPVADGFKAIGGSARGRTPVDRRGRHGHNGKAANKAYPRVIRNSHRPVPARP